ncbi:C40 family peptidase [Nocardiopsis changdeensis]|nr:MULTISPECIES: C40 family peptidase [Nocardiopsis]
MSRLVAGISAGLFLLVSVIAAIGMGDEERHRAEQETITSVPGIHPVLLDAYQRAAAHLADTHPGCTGLTWPVLAGIGHEESHHAAGSTITPTGDTDPPIIGPLLDGTGVGNNWTPHYDTDQGRWDGDTTYDAAVGVTQLLPAWWADHGADGNNDTRADPHNVYDATWSSAIELCTSHPEQQVDFTDAQDLHDALFRYNPWDTYVDNVLAHIEHYQQLTASTVPPGGSEQGRIAAEWALAQVGKPYLWGGTGPDSFDCSGLTMMAWHAAGVSIPRVTTDQVNTGTRVDLDVLAPGDLLFYDTGSGPAPSHVTMYVGDGQMVHAPSSGQTIRVEPVAGAYYSARFMSATRPH